MIEDTINQLHRDFYHKLQQHSKEKTDYWKLRVEWSYEAFQVAVKEAKIINPEYNSLAVQQVTRDYNKYLKK